MVSKKIKTDERLKALEEAVGFDYIIDEYRSRDFTEYVISIGGDVLTYRVYENNGKYSVFGR